jgi:hypothetical protein
MTPPKYRQYRITQRRGERRFSMSFVWLNADLKVGDSITLEGRNAPPGEWDVKARYDDVVRDDHPTIWGRWRVGS